MCRPWSICSLSIFCSLVKPRRVYSRRDCSRMSLGGSGPSLWISKMNLSTVNTRPTVLLAVAIDSIRIYHLFDAVFLVGCLFRVLCDATQLKSAPPDPASCSDLSIHSFSTNPHPSLILLSSYLQTHRFSRMLNTVECEDCGSIFPLQQNPGRCIKCEKLKPHNHDSPEYADILVCEEFIIVCRY